MPRLFFTFSFISKHVFRWLIQGCVWLFCGIIPMNNELNFNSANPQLHGTNSNVMKDKKKIRSKIFEPRRTGTPNETSFWGIKHSPSLLREIKGSCDFEMGFYWLRVGGILSPGIGYSMGQWEHLEYNGILLFQFAHSI